MSAETITFKHLSYSNGVPLSLTEKSFSLPQDLQSDELLIQINSASLNPVDLILYNTASFIFFKRNEKGIGRDFSGTVYAIGSEVKDYLKGDKVSGIYKPIYGDQGSLGEYLKFKLSDVSMGKIPKNLTLSESASFPIVFGTAVSILRTFHVPGPESRVLILGGATSVGHYVIQLLKTYHEAKSIVSVNSGNSEQLVKQLGADVVIDYTKEDIAKSVLKLIEKNYNGEKFDLIVDCVGNNDLFPIINDVLKPKTENSGYVTIVGDQIADYNKSMLGYFSFSTVKKLIPFLRNYNYGFVSTCDDYYPLAKELFEAGKLKTIIDSCYPLDEYKEAFEKLATHKAKGKIVINIEN